MCLVCVEWQAGKLTNKEALRNLGEMIKSEDQSGHYYQVVDQIMDKELGKFEEEDSDMASAWHDETHGD